MFGPFAIRDMMKQKGQMHKKIKLRLMDKNSIINFVRACLATVCESGHSSFEKIMPKYMIVPRLSN